MNWQLVGILSLLALVHDSENNFLSNTFPQSSEKSNENESIIFRSKKGLTFSRQEDPNPVRRVKREKRTLRIGVLAPADPPFQYSMQRILSPITMAVQSERIRSYLPGWDIDVIYRDTKCSSTIGPLVAVDFYINKTADVFLGPMCDYVIAPVARYAGYWNIPVLTPGAQADAFRHKHPHYPTLTRFAGSYSLVGEGFSEILTRFGWRHVALVYHNFAVASGKGHSLCHFTLGTVYTALNSTPAFTSFDETQSAPINFREILTQISRKARIVVLCASPSRIREILLAAEELQMVSSGEYVFFNVELFTNPKDYRPWYNQNSTDDDNSRAKLAYEALLTLTVRPPPNSDEYLAFDANVKTKAMEKFNFSFGDEPVNPFVTAFYDAVLLYAMALNETLREGGSVSNGTDITRRMWGKTFQGITGNVSIDDNGDRNADYSLLDMNPDSGYFEVVAHYSGKTKEIIDVQGKKIHWAGNRDSAPPDTPKCGFDGSGCPTMPQYAIVVIVLSSALVIILISFFFIYRIRET